MHNTLVRFTNVHVKKSSYCLKVLNGPKYLFFKQTHNNAQSQSLHMFALKCANKKKKDKKNFFCLFKMLASQLVLAPEASMSKYHCTAIKINKFPNNL